MLPLERRLALAELLQRNPILTVDELASRFHVSTQTVRRDFQFLEGRGVITRTHGGAVARRTDTLSPELRFNTREVECRPEKQAIAVAAMELVENGSTVVMDASTSVLYLARALPIDIELNVIVNALPLALELSKRPRVTLTTLGGLIRSTSLSATGPIAEATLRRLFVDTAFVSVRGLSVRRGLTEANSSESALKEIMLTNAKRIVALVDSSKLERTAFSHFGPVTAIDVLITDDHAEPALVHELERQGIEVRVVTVHAQIP